MAHACRYHAYDCKAVERILRAKSRPRTLEAVRNEKAAAELRNALQVAIDNDSVDGDCFLARRPTIVPAQTFF